MGIKWGCVKQQFLNDINRIIFHQETKFLCVEARVTTIKAMAGKESKQAGETIF